MVPKRHETDRRNRQTRPTDGRTWPIFAKLQRSLSCSFARSLRRAFCTAVTTYETVCLAGKIVYELKSALIKQRTPRSRNGQKMSNSPKKKMSLFLIVPQESVLKHSFPILR